MYVYYWDTLKDWRLLFVTYIIIKNLQWKHKSDLFYCLTNQKILVAMDAKNTRTTSTNFRSRRGRRPAMVKQLSKIKGPEEWAKIVYNENGQPIGDTRHDLASYSGLLVKSFVPINCKDWHKVPKTIKKKLWNALHV